MQPEPVPTSAIRRGALRRCAQPLQRYFDQVLGLGARDQHAGIDLERQPPELLPPGQVLHGDAIGAALEQIVILGELGRAESMLGMRVEPGAVAPEQVQQEQLRGEGR